MHINTSENLINPIILNAKTLEKRAVALHSYFFPKVSAPNFQSFGKQTLHVERSGAAFYMHCLYCWVVGRHLQVF